MEKLTNDEIQAKADSLTEKLKNKVTPIVITDESEAQVIGYFQEAEYDVRLYASDMYYTKEISKAKEAIFRNCLIQEESSPVLQSKERKDAKIVASFVNECLQFVVP